MTNSEAFFKRFPERMITLEDFVKRLKTISPCYILRLVEDNFKFYFSLFRNKVFLDVLSVGISTSRAKRKEFLYH